MSEAQGARRLDRSVSICMPAYNEEENLPAMVADVVEVMRARCDDWELVVANDGSRDRTGAVLEELAQRVPELKPVHHAVNQGYGAAAYTAISHASKEVVLFTDSDRQFVLSEIDRLWPYLERADLVAGYRAPRRDPFLRVVFGWGWSALVTLLFGYTVRDVDCAFKLFRRELFDVVGPSIGARGATFSAEWLVRARRAGFTIAEAPVSHLPRRAGSPTGARLDVILRAFRELWQLRLQLWREGRTGKR
jgi:glycosyltransferase involved in cell wall biosynthesis